MQRQSNTPNKRLLETSRFSVEEVTRELPDGGSRTRAVIRHPGAVVILPVLDDRQICLIKNYRVSVGKTLIELAAGTLEPNEDPLEAARRELAEETGYRAATWQLLHQFYPSPGILDERMYLYSATDLKAGEAAREPGEEIENLIIDLDEALEMVHNGQIEDAKTIVGLLLWASKFR